MLGLAEPIAEEVVFRLAEEPLCPQPVEVGNAVVVVFAQGIGTGREILVAVETVVLSQEIGPARETLAVMMLAVVLVFAQEIGQGWSRPAKSLETRPRRAPAKIIKDFMLDERDVSRAGDRYRVAIEEDSREDWRADGCVGFVLAQE